MQLVIENFTPGKAELGGIVTLLKITLGDEDQAERSAGSVAYKRIKQTERMNSMKGSDKFVATSQVLFTQCAIFTLAMWDKLQLFAVSMMLLKQKRIAIINRCFSQKVRCY